MADIDNFVNTISDNLTKISQNLRNMAITMRPNKLRSNEEWREGYIKIPKSIINVDENKKTLTLNVIHNILLREAFFLPRIIFNIKPKTKIFIKTLNDKLILEADITDNFKLYQISDYRVFIGIIKIDIQSFDEELLNKTNEDPDIPNECIIKFKPDENDKYKLLNCRLGAINEVYYYVDTVTRTNSLDLPLIRENNFPFQYGLRIPYDEHNSDVPSFIEQDYIDPEEQLDLPLLLILKPPFHKPYNLTKDEIYFLTFLNPILESQLIGSSTYHYGLASLAKLIKPEVKIKITNNKGFLREGIIDNVNFKPFNDYLQSTYTAHASIAFTIKNKTKNTGKINTETRDFSVKLSTQIPLDIANPHILTTERWFDRWRTFTEKYFLYPNQIGEDILFKRIHLVNDWNTLSFENKVNKDWNNLTPISFTNNKGQVTTNIPSESLLSSNNEYNPYNFSGRAITFKFYKIYAFTRGTQLPGTRYSRANAVINNRYLRIYDQARYAGNVFLSQFLNQGELKDLIDDTNTRKKPMTYIYINNTLIMGTLENVSGDPNINGSEGYYILGSRFKTARHHGAYQYLRIPRERQNDLPYDYPDDSKWSDYIQFLIDTRNNNNVIAHNYYFTNLSQNPARIDSFNDDLIIIPIIHFVKNITIKNPCIYGTQEDIDKINAMMINNQKPDYVKIQEMNNTDTNMYDTIDCTIKIQKNLNDFDYKNCSIEFIDDDLGGELKLPDSVEVPE